MHDSGIVFQCCSPLHTATDLSQSNLRRSKVWSTARAKRMQIYSLGVDHVAHIFRNSVLIFYLAGVMCNVQVAWLFGDCMECAPPDVAGAHFNRRGVVDPRYFALDREIAMKGVSRRNAPRSDGSVYPGRCQWIRYSTFMGDLDVTSGLYVLPRRRWSCISPGNCVRYRS